MFIILVYCINVLLSRNNLNKWHIIDFKKLHIGFVD